MSPYPAENHAEFIGLATEFDRIKKMEGGASFICDLLESVAQVSGLVLRAAPDKPCPKCETETEEWWSYCAMCGYHIAGGSPAGATPNRQEHKGE